MTLGSRNVARLRDTAAFLVVVTIAVFLIVRCRDYPSRLEPPF
ncbi:hypothetical protein ACFQJC_13310 [Haloferax namakaokahaiae]|uniref:Uncharacterized protein n=1 Tax=Haloferax namakaokahaiae TaxID=1748331 RepID=A0ABD5ZHC9_9EURY